MNTCDRIKSYRRYVEAKVASNEEPITFSEWREPNGIKQPEGESHESQEAPAV